MNFRTQAWKRFQDQKTIIQLQLRCSTHRRSNTKCHFFDIFTRLILRIFHFYNVLISVQSTSTTHGRVICQRCRTKMMHRLLILSLNAWIMYQMWRTNTNWPKKDVYQLKKTKARVKINVNKLHHELKLNHFYFGDIFVFCWPILTIFHRSSQKWLLYIFGINLPHRPNCAAALSNTRNSAIADKPRDAIRHY